MNKEFHLAIIMLSKLNTNSNYIFHIIPVISYLNSLLMLVLALLKNIDNGSNNYSQTISVIW